VRVGELQRSLADYGYGLERTGDYDTATTEVVTAFQRHFRPAKVDGIADVSTLATLDKLLMARDQPAPSNEPKPDPPKVAKPIPGEQTADPLKKSLFGHPLTPDA
jgi:peptidoglycan hydrolase-like protein with peptidoglycan-binding domain